MSSALNFIKSLFTSPSCCLCEKSNRRFELISCKDHRFHKTCLTQWLGEGHRVCPGCLKIDPAKIREIRNASIQNPLKDLPTAIQSAALLLDPKSPTDSECSRLFMKLHANKLYNKYFNLWTDTENLVSVLTKGLSTIVIQDKLEIVGEFVKQAEEKLLSAVLQKAKQDDLDSLVGAIELYTSYIEFPHEVVDPIEKISFVQLTLHDLQTIYHMNRSEIFNETYTNLPIFLSGGFLSSLANVLEDAIQDDRMELLNFCLENAHLKLRKALFNQAVFDRKENLKFLIATTLELDQS
jgi:hypothetical protein